MGTKLILPDTFTSTTGKLLLDDPILPVTGALMLIDVAHSLGGLGTASVPSDLGVIPNIATTQAAALIGSGDATTLGAIFDRADGTNFNLERTSKKGIHGYLSGSLAAGVGLLINMPTLLQTYLAANLTHKYYLSAWDRVTRVGSLSSVWPMFEGIQAVSSATVNYLTYFDSTSSGDGMYPAAGARLGARITPAKNTVGNTFRNGAVNGQTGTIATVRQQLALWGNLNAYSGLFAGTTAAPSFIFYRLYLEDLTVSGRTYAEVDAIDYAQWQTDFASGGRFYGDTFTASPI
jgi:hypothetical protein